jgi:hypothetical protein
MLQSTDELRERAARNHSLFRGINEAIARRAHQAPLEINSAVCECTDAACVERIDVSLEEYDALREHPARYAVFPRLRHVDVEAERVVAYTDRYWAVEKVADPERALVQR